MILKELRKAKGVSQEETAKALGITLRTYQNYEYGQREPNIDMILKMSEYFCVSTDYLLGRSGKSDPLEALGLADGEKSALEKYMQLPENARKIIIDALIQLGEAARNGSKSPDEIRRELKKVVYEFLSVHKASAGCGYDLNDSDQWTSVEVYDTPELHEADFAVTVEGKSMMPMFEDGDIVYVIKADEVPLGQIGLFQQNGKGYIKKSGADRLISINPDYDDIFPSDGEIVVCGIVIGKALMQ